MKLTIFVILLGLVIVFAGFSSGSNEKDTMDSTDDTMEMSAGDSGGMVVFTTLEDVRLAAAKGPAVLFLNAGWCPTCRAAVADIGSRLEDLGDITVFIIDYDNEKELKAIYNVAYQHTFVQIDGDGKAVSLWNGGGVDHILSKVTKMEKS